MAVDFDVVSSLDRWNHLGCKSYTNTYAQILFKNFTYELMQVNIQQALPLLVTMNPE